MKGVKYLKDQIKRTGFASYSKLNKKELQLLKYKIDDYKHSLLQVDVSRYRYGDMKKTIKLTDEQYDIVVAPKDKHYKVIACAGSGKTTTILCRIKYLIDSGVMPYNIMLTTFNVDAAENMKTKLEQLFGFNLSIYIGTIDALSYRFYNMYFKRDDFIGVSEYCTEFLKFLRSDNKNVEKIKERFKYVFFDEFQDCNDVQFEIIKELAKTAYVTVIGDDAQNIYQWRGSNMDFILNFENYMEDIKNDNITEGCKIMTLKNNFRSTPEIINLSNSSIKNNTDQIPKQMLSIKKSCNRLPVIYKYKTEDEQAIYIVAYIARYIKNNIPQEQIAILARNNYSIKAVEEEIEKYNKLNENNKINYVALISDDTRDTKPKIMKNHITLTTIHKSKGLEWDVVFILSCNDDIFPAETTPIKLQEDRRLFYVGVTRAKRYLNFSFTSKTITRFIGELDRNLYTFKDTKKSYFIYNDNRNIKFKNGVTKLIEMLEPKDIELMRTDGIIPDIIPFTRKIHNSHTYAKYIDDYYLHADYGIYIDRYISRQLGLMVPNSGGLIDSIANRVLHTVNLEPKLYKLFIKYNHNIQKKIDRYRKLKVNKILKKIDKSTNDPKYIKYIDNADKKDLLELLHIIIKSSISINVYPSQLFITPRNYMPYEYQNKFKLSYKNYRTNKNSLDIRKDIYNVSLCQNVYDGRRRLLYKDCFDKFDTDKDLYEDINNWVASFRYKKILTKKCLIHEKLSICGELDMIVLNDGYERIIDFKCSLRSECKLEWILQLMMYSALYKYMYNKIINNFSIYNPLSGTVIDIDLGMWSKHTELLVYMDKIRIV